MDFSIPTARNPQNLRNNTKKVRKRNTFPQLLQFSVSAVLYSRRRSQIRPSRGYTFWAPFYRYHPSLPAGWAGAVLRARGPSEDSILKPLINGAPLMSRGPPLPGIVTLQGFLLEKPYFLNEDPSKTMVSEGVSLGKCVNNALFVDTCFRNCGFRVIFFFGFFKGTP